ncbi:MAG TPA: polyprenyl synthetase family protein [Candidatus Hydrogenedens sp.]|nr:polyprenyl synthetase family protein [Candidatus Hydrogenedens sp.]HOL18848.1 polyprenyl synthetase family protein [Candidatus Hydrogenedens sp.]HPP59746.1 polyprenyl synthetase family protein [Candidatus Hydrogenedens sp.]
MNSDFPLIKHFNPSQVDQFLSEKGAQTEKALRSYIQRLQCPISGLIDAMEYSLFSGGKRLRPALVLGASDLVGGETDRVLPIACAIEMIHTYSLIHDDLPALDNDDFRRGKPTLHKVYGEAVALLAGDGLLTLAFELLAGTGKAEVVAEVAHSAGVNGMVGGQFLDMDAEGHLVSLETLQQIHKKKTGALICTSLRCGAILSNATPEQIQALTDYGEHLGLAFQITDDILNVVGDEKTLGKPVGTDKKHKKSTYPALLGLEQARQFAYEHVREAIIALESFGDKAEMFRQLALYVFCRDH